MRSSDCGTITRYKKTRSDDAIEKYRIDIGDNRDVGLMNQDCVPTSLRDG
jgi:hypothetical protein